MQSWGKYPLAKQTREIPLYWTSACLPQQSGKSLLPHGLGRSYGDSCLNSGNIVLLTRGLDRLLMFDVERGVLRCESGVSFEEILRLVVPRGWFLPVTPGTKFVTVGGALANDVHGKNHHVAGSFGNHVREFELLRSDGSRLRCSPTSHKEWFKATIGGMGLTGLVTWVEFSLLRIESSRIEMESVRFENLQEYAAILEELEKDYQYSVAWVDCLSGGANLGRGILYFGNHAKEGLGPWDSRSHLRVPHDAPSFLLSAPIQKAFNALYYHRHVRKTAYRTVACDPFFYPLDGIADWNRLYGKRGFLQYQCVVPSLEAAKEILRQTASAGQGSTLAVLKSFGDIASQGLLSFPRKGVTLALDFANTGNSVLRHLDRLDSVRRESGGAIYPAKDARMPSSLFESSNP